MLVMRGRLVWIVCLAVTISFTPWGWCGVVLIARDSNVEYADLIGGKTDIKTTSTDRFGLYTDSISSEKSAAGGSSGSTTARQTTDVQLVNGSVRSSGELFTQASAQFDPAGNDVPMDVGTTSTHVVTFQVTGQSERFHISGDFGVLHLGGSDGSVEVFRSDPVAGLPSFDWIIYNDQAARFGKSADLPPGEYKLVVAVNAAAVNFGENNGQDFGNSSQVRFSFEAGPAAVPLPPAIQSGAMLLIFAAAWRRIGSGMRDHV